MQNSPVELVVMLYMASSDEWYTNSRWGDVEERVFFQRLSRARLKGRYLRLKALALSETGDPIRLQSAIELIERALKEWPDDYLKSVDHHGLASLHSRLGHYELAIEHYRQSISDEDRTGLIHTSSHVDFVVLALRHAPQLLEEAGRVVARRDKRMLHGSYVERFVLRAARAILRYQQGDKAKAGTDAAWALNAAARQHSGLDRYPKLGLVEGMDDIIERVRAIANETLGTSDFSPR